MATALRFDEGMKRFIQYGLKECMISHVEHLAVDIQLDGIDVGYITADGKITVTAKGFDNVVAQSVTFTETQWLAIALKAREFRERCAQIAQEQQAEAQEQTGAAGALTFPVPDKRWCDSIGPAMRGLCFRLKRC